MGRKICVGLLAHVDAGKTTLSEAMLYAAGRLKSPGRVDHRDTFLDTHEIERERGITIFSKQAIFRFGEAEVTLLDTPGHVDFSAEAERTLPVLDCAVLVISATDGVQAHTRTLWELLGRYRVPVFVFVTKMDLPGADRARLMEELKQRLSENCVLFAPKPDAEELALCSENLLEKHLAGGIGDGDVAGAVGRRELFPCFFGSGLKLDGVAELLGGLTRFAPAAEYSKDFAARVFKITRDAQGARLTWVKLTGGTLQTRRAVVYTGADGEAREEKISQIRLYSGAKFTAAEAVTAGSVCALLGLSDTWPGQGLGAEKNASAPLLEPVLAYRLTLPKEIDPLTALPKLRQLAEEDPQLHIVWDEALGEIRATLMGKVQIEVLRRLVADRFGWEIGVNGGRILYRETIAAPVEGVGHFEPLRHYAEVHLLLQPLERGAGLVFDTACSEDALDRNWQRLILTHLEEKRHRGVLTGSPITDMKITLLAGRAHVKHTEGGDFRQATYRAVRQGLMCAESVLLEPWYSFSIELPPELIGRAISDVRAMHGEFSTPEESGELTRLSGFAPVSEMRGYATQLAAYTGGRGRFSCRAAGYRPCHDSGKVIEEIGYDPERDLDNTPDSVFCAHGGGFTVKWDKVPEYMHLDSAYPARQTGDTPPLRRLSIDERELEAIMEREFGPVRRPLYRAATAAERQTPLPEPKKQYLIVDGYNVIFAWDELKELARDNLDAARSRLLDILSNYRGFTGSELVLVFDAYRVSGGAGAKFDRHGVHVVYTKENETGDAYIERLVHDIGRNFAVRVVTSDALIQLSALRSGVLRVSAREFYGEVRWVYERINEVLQSSSAGAHKARIGREKFEKAEKDGDGSVNDNGNG